MNKILAKENCWFDSHTEVKLVEQITSSSGLFLGMVNGLFDKHVCDFDQFYEIYLKEKRALSNNCICDKDNPFLCACKNSCSCHFERR